MINYYIKDFKRTKDGLKTVFSVNESNTICNRNVSILFPSYYLKKNLAAIEGNVEVLCVFMILDKEKDLYSVALAPIKQIFSPNKISEVMLNDTSYMEMEFLSGEIAIPNNHAVVTESFLFDVLESFYLLGKVPAFLTYDDLSNIFVEARKYAGSKIGDNPIVMQMITSIITRVKGDEEKFYKEVLKNPGDDNKYIERFIGLKDPFFSFDSTASGIIGGYLEEGMIGSIMQPETKPTVIGEILKA